MKFKGLLVTLGLSLAVGVGVGVGLNADKPVEVKADPVTYSGHVIVQKNDSDMRWDGCKLVWYLFDSSSHTAWATPVENLDQKYQDISWSGLSFNPETIIVLRVANTWSDADPWKGADIYCRTGNVTLSGTHVIWMNGDATEGSKWGNFGLDAVVKGGASDTWSVATVDTALSNYKTNGSQIEAYGSVTLPADTYFKVLKGGSEWCGTYSAHSSIEDNLSGGGDNNIHNTAAATYEMYFDYEGKTTYITDPVLAAADDWAQDFLGAGCTATKAGWAASGTSYAALPDGSKALFLAEAHVDHEEAVSGYVKQAVQRYDYVLERYGTGTYADFMGRVEAGKVTPKAANNVLGGLEGSNNTPAIMIVAFSSLAALALGGFFFVRSRRKSDR